MDLGFVLFSCREDTTKAILLSKLNLLVQKLYLHCSLRFPYIASFKNKYFEESVLKLLWIKKMVFELAPVYSTNAYLYVAPDDIGSGILLHAPRLEHYNVSLPFLFL